jgi:hypothetical protein
LRVAPRLGDADRHERRTRLGVVIVSLGLVAVERIGPQSCPKCHVRGLLRFHRAAWKFGQDGEFAGGSRDLPHRDAAEPEVIGCLELARMTATNDDQTGGVEFGREDDIEGRSQLALEALGGRSLAHHIRRRPQEAARGRPEEQTSSQNTTRTPRDGKAKAANPSLKASGIDGLVVQRQSFRSAMAPEAPLDRASGQASAKMPRACYLIATP